MGMFDTITYPEISCRVCGTPVNNYQSKSGNCELETLTPEQLLQQSDEPGEAYFYGYCHDDNWNAPGVPHHENLFKVTAAGVEAVEAEL